MKKQQWWRPGLPGGLLSRRWAQPLVFRLPRLSRSELEASLRYKAQSLLPSQDHSLHPRLFQHKGVQYGLVIVDRLPHPKPEPTGLALGVPLVLPPHWPSVCMLAVATPEGWELHEFEDHVLHRSYPPVLSDSGMVQQILGKQAQRPVFGVDPTQEGMASLPDWCRAAPGWKASLPWGIPWSPPKPRRWPYFLAVFLAVVGLAGWILTLGSVTAQKEERNRRWETWTRTAQAMVGSMPAQDKPGHSSNPPSDEPILEVLGALGTVWPTGVEIQTMEVRGGRVNLSARAPSALAAASRLAQSPLTAGFRVTQIRPVSGGEEFDLEGRLEP